MKNRTRTTTAIAGVVIASFLTSASARPSAPEADLEQVVADAAPSGQPALLDETFVDRGVVTAAVDDHQVQISLDRDGSIISSDAAGSVAIDALPDVDLSRGEVLDGGSVAFDAEDGTALGIQPMEDASVRLAVVIDSPSPPQEYEYP